MVMNEMVKCIIKLNIMDWGLKLICDDEDLNLFLFLRDMTGGREVYVSPKFKFVLTELSISFYL